MRYESSVVIDRPIDEVWAFIFEPFNIPHWGGGRLAFRVKSPGALGLGSSLEQRVVFFGFESVLRTVVTEWDPPNTMTHSTRHAGRLIRSASAGLTLEATAAGTRVTRVFKLEPRGILKLVLPIVSPFVRRRGDAQTRNLKRLLEAGRGERRGSIDAR